jgi:hypothetical protein
MSAGPALALVVAVAIVAAGCGEPQAQPAPREVVVWKQLGSWSGHGNAQTESFVGLTGSLRFHWRASTKDSKQRGGFKLILHSAISGRDLQAPVDQEGPGEGTAYAADDPRVFFVTVESDDLDWSFTVEEAAFATASP